MNTCKCGHAMIDHDGPYGECMEVVIVDRNHDIWCYCEQYRTAPAPSTKEEP